MTRCASCAGSELRPELRIRDHRGEPARLVRCRHCALVQVEELPSEAELAAYYSRYCYDDASAWECSAATRASLERLASRLEPYRASNRLLDVGCGAGDILRVMRGRGWVAEGSELSEAAASRLEGEGLRVYRGAIQSLELPEGFDVVIFSEVIEHLRDPRAALERARLALRPGGAIYLTTPNFASLSRRLLADRWRLIEVPEHLFYFCPRSIRHLLGSLGLRPAQVWTEGLNPYAIWAGLRRGRDPQAFQEGAQAAQALRASATTSRRMALLKSSVNAGLRATGLGDTLKAIAERL